MADSADAPEAARGRRAHPLGPVFERSSPDDVRRVRMWAGVALLLAGAVVATLLYLQPDPSGHGTHTQLGWPTCSWPATWGIPCPTCGVTTGMAWFARGRWLRAAATQPLALILGLVLLAGTANSLAGLVIGRWWRVNWFRVSPRWTVVASIMVILAAWGYKLLAMRGTIG